MAGDLQSTVYGDFAADYAVSRLSALCEPDGGIQTGPFGSQLHQEDYVEAGTPIITVEHLGENRIVHSDIPCVSEADRERLSRYALRKSDIVFSRVGSVDRRALVRDDEDGWLFSGRCLRVRPDPARIDARYLSYFFGLPAFKEHIRAIAVGATMPSLNTQLLSDVIVCYPAIGEQRAIAYILGTLDDKIELNRRMNETLEAMARAVFKSWFVDFDPVRAKAEGRQPPGIDATTAALFPDRFEDSELGETPAGWLVKRLDEIATFLNGLALQKYPPNEHEWLPVIKIAQLRKGNTEDADRASAKIPSEYIVDDGDVLFSWSGSLECVFWVGGRGALNQHLFKVTSERLPRWFYYFCIHEHLQAFRRIASGKATTMGHIQRYHLSEALATVPDQRVLATAHGLIAPLVETIIRNSIQSRTLATLRDTLLPKLLSGELRVSDAPRSAQEAPKC